MNLQSIADQLKISRSTVSRALRGDERISQATRSRVAETANLLGYKSNPYLSILMSKLREGMLPTSSPVIAFIDPDTDLEVSQAKGILGYTHDGAMTRAKELGFELERFYLGQKDMTGARLRGILIARNIRAIVLCDSFSGKAEKDFDLKGFASVSVKANGVRSVGRSVTPDFLGNTFKAIEGLRNLGYKRIGLALTGVELERMNYLPRMAFRDYELSLEAKDQVGYWTGETDGFESFAQWLYENEPDALVTSEWLPQKWIQPFGLRIPTDLGVAQLDPHFTPFRNSGVDGRFEQIGGLAVDFLVSQLASNDFESSVRGDIHLTAGEWHTGWSTRDMTNEPAISSYTAKVKNLLSTVSGNIKDPSIYSLRRDLARDQEQSGFAKNAKSEQWKFIPLTGVANAIFEVPSWPPYFPVPDPLPSITGYDKIRGVPFDWSRNFDSDEPSCIVLNSMTVPRTSHPFKLKVSEKRQVKAVYICHFSFYGWFGDAKAGSYDFHYTDGSTEVVDLVSYTPPSNPASVATHQDSWIAHPQFEAEKCKCFHLHSEDVSSLMDRYGYVLEIPIKDQQKRLSSISFNGNPDSDSVMLIAGVTLLCD